MLCNQAFSIVFLLVTVTVSSNRISNGPIKMTRLIPAMPLLSSPSDQHLPLSWDWREHGEVGGGKVGREGNCLAGWAFAAAGAIEAAWQLATGAPTPTLLSVQQLVDCSSRGSQQCRGGTVEQAFAYAIGCRQPTGWDAVITNASIYPYTAGNESSAPALPRQCADWGQRDWPRVSVKDFVQIPSRDDDRLMWALVEHGPVAAAIDASPPSFANYTKGVYSDPACSNSEIDLNHAVLVIGYGVGGDDIPYWLIKNSWGSEWGIDGYAKIRRGPKGVCGVSTRASYPLVDAE